MNQIAKDKINELLYKRLELISDFASNIAVSIPSKMIVTGGICDVSYNNAKVALNSTSQCGLIIADLLWRNNTGVYNDDLKTLGNGSVKRVPDFIPKLKYSKKDEEALYQLHCDIRDVTKAFRRDLFVAYDNSASMSCRALLEHTTSLMSLHNMFYSIVV